MVEMAFLVFIGFFVSTTGLESSFLRPEQFPKRFSFGGGGRVRFFFSEKIAFLLRKVLAIRGVSDR